MINWLHISDLHLGSEGAITNMMRDDLPDYLKELGVKCVSIRRKTSLQLLQVGPSCYQVGQSCIKLGSICYKLASFCQL